MTSFGLNWIKFRAVSYLLSCTRNITKCFLSFFFLNASNVLTISALTLFKQSSLGKMPVLKQRLELSGPLFQFGLCIFKMFQLYFQKSRSTFQNDLCTFKFQPYFTYGTRWWHSNPKVNGFTNYPGNSGHSIKSNNFQSPTSPTTQPTPRVSPGQVYDPTEPWG